MRRNMDKWEGSAVSDSWQTLNQLPHQDEVRQLAPPPPFLPNNSDENDDDVFISLNVLRWRQRPVDLCNFQHTLYSLLDYSLEAAQWAKIGDACHRIDLHLKITTIIAKSSPIYLMRGAYIRLHFQNVKGSILLYRNFVAPHKMTLGDLLTCWIVDVPASGWCNHIVGENNISKCFLLFEMLLYHFCRIRYVKSTW